MENQMQPKVLSLEEKKERWIHALRRKLEMRTLEEWDYETMSETIYKDDVLEFYRECQEDYVLVNVHDKYAGVSAGLEDFFEDYYDLGELLHIDTLRGMTFMDYMATKEFPITFQTWPDDTEEEYWDLNKGIKHGKRKQ